MSQVIEYPRVPDDCKHKIQVKLRWFRKHGETLIGEESLEELTLHDLQDIFDVYINNALFNCWHVKTRHARVLQRLTNHRIAIKKFTYFVEQEGYYGEAANS